MQITALTLRDFRNHAALDLTLTDGMTLFYGANAAGKTSILEAVFVLATTRSPRAGNDRELIRFDAVGDIGVPPFTRLVGSIARRTTAVQLELVVQRRDADDGGAAVSKTARVDRRPVRLFDMVGQLRVVLFSPGDIELVTGPPAARRRYLDVTLSQIDGRYMRMLAQYNRVLQQRNSLLRGWRDGRRPAHRTTDELQYWDDQLTSAGAYVIEQRRAAITALELLAAPIAQQIGTDATAFRLHYLAHVAQDAGLTAVATIAPAFRQALEHARDDDLARGQTTVGPHRDDLAIAIEGHALGAFGSRGQQRSATLALRLAEAALMDARTGERPVVLLDDLLSELDLGRRERLLQLLGDAAQQTLITATGLEGFDTAFLRRARLARVDAGRVYAL